MRVKDDQLVFLPIEDYAQEAVQYERYPRKIFYNYGFPQELAEVK